jgi:hypothetical protein
MNIRLSFANLVSLLAFVSLLSGCISPLPVSEADRAKISVVKVNSYVRKSRDIYYLGPGSGVELQDYAQQNGVFVEKIVVEELERALRESGKVKLAESADAAVPMVNTFMLMYGFSVRHGFNWVDVVPILSLVCEMVGTTGKVLWRAEAKTTPLGNPVEAIPAEQLRKNPKDIEDAWRRAARHIAEHMVKTL